MSKLSGEDYTSSDRRGSCHHSFRSCCFGFLILVFWMFLEIEFANDQDDTIPNVYLENWEGFPDEAYDDEIIASSYPCQPKQLHLAQATNARQPVESNDNDQYTISMTISFTLDYLKCPPSRVQPVIHYGLVGQEEQVLEATALPPLQFNYSTWDTDYGASHSDWIYHVQVNDLIVGLAEYWYNVTVYNKNVNDGIGISETTITGPNWNEALLQRHRRPNLPAEHSSNSQEVIGATPTHTFRTPPRPGRPTTMAVVGDLGHTELSAKIMAHIWKASSPEQTQNGRDDTTPKVVSNFIIPGDISYANAHPERWSEWFQLAEPLLRQVPLSVAVGNHEIECNANTLDVFDHYEFHFRVPNRILAARKIPITDEYLETLHYQNCVSTSRFRSEYNYGNSFYSYTHGLVHVIVLNSYSFSDVGTPQYNWVKEELEQNVDRSITPWLVVVCHVPFYSTFHDHAHEAEDMRTSMEPLFIEHQVNFVWSGHNHAYQRTHPLQYGRPTSTGPVHFILGAAGSPEGYSKYNNSEFAEDFVAQRERFHPGYGLFHFENATHAQYQYVTDTSTIHESTKSEFQDNVWFLNHHYMNQEEYDEENTR